MPKDPHSRSATEVVGRMAWLRLLGVIAGGLIVVAVGIAACGGGDGTSPPTSSDSDRQDQTDDDQSQTPSAEQIVREREFSISSSDVGEHLEEKSYEVGLPYWLEASDEEELAALPTRALASSGIFFSPSPESSTQETLWLHVFTDESDDSAVDWVKYVASQPESLASAIVWHHELFAARLSPAPVVGDASVSIEMFHGHGGLCLRSGLLIFAQERVLVFLFNSIDITIATDGPQPAPGDDGIPAQCAVAGAVKRLTDNDEIALLISERLSADP